MGIDLGEGSRAHRTAVVSTMAVGNLLPLIVGQEVEGGTAAMCVEATRVLTGVLDRFDVPARPMVVDAMVFNMRAWQLKERHVPVAQWPSDAWSVGIVADGSDRTRSRRGLADGMSGWAGHMVVRVAKRFICDANAGQMRREGLIDMPPSWVVDWPDVWISPKSDRWATFGIGASTTPNDPTYAVLQLRPRPDNRGYLEGTAWTADVDEYVEVLGGLVESVADGSADDQIGLAVGDEQTVVDITALKRRWDTPVG